MRGESGAKTTVLLCGGSSGSHVLAALLGGRDDYAVRLVTRAPERWTEQIRCTEKRVPSDTFPILMPSWTRIFEGSLAAIYGWDRISEAAEGVDLIVLACPVHAHRAILESLLPVLDPERHHVLGTLYAQGARLRAF
ncbi:MAG: hypothetical protein AAF637_25660, partial [Pseudomonadota bacterium]